jgi:hypothetical protein
VGAETYIMLIFLALGLNLAIIICDETGCQSSKLCLAFLDRKN